MKKFFIKTYGCQMNERDSDSAAAMLEEAGFLRSEDEKDADVVILNTCSVRDQAERKAIGKLQIMKCLKETRPGMVFGIMGCMAQSRGEELLKSVKHLDFAVGTDRIHEIPSLVKGAIEGKKKVLSIERADADSPGVDAHRLKCGEAVSAFISISRGCSRFCSYCIVPFTRGPERSRNADSIVAEAQMLADKGVKEIMLLGQNVASYGLDKQPPPPPPDVSPFADLLERISAIDGIKRIRFTSPHPAFFNDKLISTIARLPKVCKCIHLPMQSGSDRILKKMNRPYDSAGYFAIIEKLRALVPTISFTTDVIVGYPTETDEDFNATREMMEKVSFDNAFIFKYSPRKGTLSSRMEDDVPTSVKEERNQILLQDMEKRSERKNALLDGRVFSVLVEGPSKRNASRWAGRTDGFRMVIFTPTENVMPGDLVDVRITRTTPMTLYGDVVS